MTPRRRGACSVAGLALVPALGFGAPPDEARVEQPRGFGHVVGDLLTQRVRLVRDGRAFEPVELPPAARLGVWLERRNGRLETAPDGSRWLVVDYQVINTPREIATVQMAAYEMADAGGAALKVPAAPVMLAPLAPKEPDKTGFPAYQDDRAAPSIELPPLKRGFVAATLATLLLALAWPGWWAWRNWQAARSRPFARAWAVLRHEAEGSPQAWQALHRAFDASAGRVLQSGNLARLFDQAPQFAPLRADIERFYRESALRFFGAGPAGETASLRRLCDACRRIERAAEP